MIRYPVGRRRGRNRRYAIRDRNPDLRRMTHGVMVICLGFLLFFIGVILTLLGVSSSNKARASLRKSSSSENLKTDPLLILGPILLALGFFVGTVGGIFYGKYYRRFQTVRNDHNHSYGNQGVHIDDFHGESYKRTVSPNLTPTTNTSDSVFTVESARSDI